MWILDIPLALAMSHTPVLNRFAMNMNVSPGLMTYVVLGPQAPIFLNDISKRADSYIPESYVFDSLQGGLQERGLRKG